MVPGAFDPLQVLLVKACFYAKQAAETVGATGADGMYPNMSPQFNDSLQVLAAKLAYWLQQLAGGGSSGGVLSWDSGSGSPEGVVTGSPGDRWWDNDTGNEYVKVTGTATNTGWAIH